MTTIQETVDLFLDQDFTDRTRVTYRTALNHLMAYLPELKLCGDSPVETLSQLDKLTRFPGWLSEELSRNSRALTFTVLSVYVAFLVRENYLPEVDYTAHMRLKDTLARSAKREREQRQLALRLPDQEIVDALVEAARTPPEIPDSAKENTRQRMTLAWLRDLAIVLTLQSSGMRVSEVSSLTRRDLDLNKRSAKVMGKGRKVRLVKISDEATAAVRNYLEQRQDGELIATPLGGLPVFCRHDKGSGKGNRTPLTPRSIQRMIEKLANQSGVVERFHMTPHKLRHYFGSRFLRLTGDLAMTQEFLGHSSPNTTRIYAQPSQDDMSRAYDRVFKKRN